MNKPEKTPSVTDTNKKSKLAWANEFVKTETDDGKNFRYLMIPVETERKTGETIDGRPYDFYATVCYINNKRVQVKFTKNSQFIPNDDTIGIELATTRHKDPLTNELVFSDFNLSTEGKYATLWVDKVIGELTKKGIETVQDDGLPF